ncbi:MAG: hypothetical protein K2X73_03530 [Sphingomonas sp.]|uniref:hypothetical protein n=1 Tax=Sphingomonas sp. TaxID=28214 RepID=UPI0025E3FD5D|nr:hypothetical protein [Sphingomonas sp.]MBX9881023.1 hypothetical protein [Sphingomonas sp.]
MAQARADEAARPARRQTRGGRLTLDHFQGWTAPVSLAALRQARGGPIPAALRPFFATGRPNLYRLTRAGIDRARPLTIGMTRTQKPIFQRIHEHKYTAQGDPRVRAALARIPEGAILVQAGILRGPDLSVSLAHVYEGLLQARERPQLKDPSTTTFED